MTLISEFVYMLMGLNGLLVYLGGLAPLAMSGRVRGRVASGPLGYACHRAQPEGELP